MAFEHYIRSGTQSMRCGFTTGTAAALATCGASSLLLLGHVPDTLRCVTPKGLEVDVEPLRSWKAGEAACCSVVKDAGDDIDVTDGLEIVATVCRASKPGVEITGGEGVGRVTLPGLDQKLGSPAINRVPRQMIEREAAQVAQKAGYTGGLRIEISIPGGELAAERTFNPNLGIVGGLSVLGTSGIVEPMSQRALIDTIELEIQQAYELGYRDLVLVPGNYGADYLASSDLDLTAAAQVRCSNFIGDALDAAGAVGFERVLLVGHVGKLVKVAGGIMNTHSRIADCRLELMCAHAAAAGADAALICSILTARTTDAALTLLQDADLAAAVLARLMSAIQMHLDRRVGGAYRVGALMFSNVYGTLGSTAQAESIISDIQAKSRIVRGEDR